MALMGITPRPYPTVTCDTCGARVTLLPTRRLCWDIPNRKQHGLCNALLSMAGEVCPVAEVRRLLPDTLHGLPGGRCPDGLYDLLYHRLEAALTQRKVRSVQASRGKAPELEARAVAAEKAQRPWVLAHRTRLSGWAADAAGRLVRARLESWGWPGPVRAYDNLAVPSIVPVGDWQDFQQGRVPTLHAGFARGWVRAALPGWWYGPVRCRMEGGDPEDLLGYRHLATDNGDWRGGLPESFVRLVGTARLSQPRQILRYEWSEHGDVRFWIDREPVMSWAGKEEGR